MRRSASSAPVNAEAGPRAVERDPAAAALLAPRGVASDGRTPAGHDLAPRAGATRDRARAAADAAPRARDGQALRRGLAAVAATLAGLGLTVAPARAQDPPAATQPGGTGTGGASGDGDPSAGTGSTGASGASGSAGPSNAAPVRLTRTQARAVQRTLHVRADGAFGARSRAALKRWERRQGLPADGRPDSEVLRRMGVPLTAAQAQGASGAAPTDQTATAASSAGQTAVRAAMTQVGTPYRSAGTGNGGFDCSGLTMWAFDKAGVDLPHSSFEQFKRGTQLAQADIQPGDLVFFDSAGPGASDVGIATSPTTTVSATTKGVVEHATFDAYWGGHFLGARRVTG